MVTDQCILDFYQALADGDEQKARSLYIPHSSVFYAREAYYQHSGDWISLEAMETAMRLEGMLPCTSVPDSRRVDDSQEV